MSFFWVGHFEFFFSEKKIFSFASFPWKSAQIYMVEWMGRNFDVFPGFQKISLLCVILRYTVYQDSISRSRFLLLLLQHGFVNLMAYHTTYLYIVCMYYHKCDLLSNAIFANMNVHCSPACTRTRSSIACTTDGTCKRLDSVTP